MVGFIFEVDIRGHEPKITSYYYPSLKKQRDLSTDLQSFEMLEKKILITSINHRDNNSPIYKILIIEPENIKALDSNPNQLRFKF